MAEQSRITIIAELKDRLSGPTGKAIKSIENLGKATDTASTKAQRGHDKMAKAAQSNSDRTARATRAIDRAIGKTIGESSRLGSAMSRAGLTAAEGVEKGMSRVQRALHGVRSSEAAQKFGEGMTRMVSYAENASQKIEKSMKKVNKVVGATALGITGASVVGGQNRLMSLETADVKLRVAGYDEAQRADIMNTVDQTLTGTPFSLDQGATMATQYLAASTPLEELDSRMATTVDLAAVYDMDLNEASGILSKVTANGLVQGDEAMQLLDRGMNIYGPLAEYLDVEQSEVKKMISDGLVTDADLFAALTPAVEGGAELLGDTTKGMFANMRTAFSRAGALVLTPLQEPLKEIMGAITQNVKDAAPFFTELGERLAPGLIKVAEVLPSVFSALEPLQGPILAFVGSFADALPYIADGLGIWATMLMMVLTPLLSVGSFLINVLGPFLPVLIPLLFSVGAAFTTLRVIRLITPLITGLTWAFRILALVMKANPVFLIAAGIYLGIKALEWLYENVEWVRTAFDWLGESIRGVLGFFDDMIAKISDLIEDKFPRLHEAATSIMNFGSGAGADGEGMTMSNWVEYYGALAGRALDLPDVGGIRDERIAGYEAKQEGHADGGFTSGNQYRVAERGREFVLNSSATSAIEAAHPGALNQANDTGRLPSTGGVTFAPVINLSGNVSADTLAIVRAELDRQRREFERTYSSPTGRGAN